MQVGVYSELAHRNVIAVQRWLSERGFTSSPESIRAARQELIATAATDASIASALTFTDFYTTSEFRDLFRPTQMLRFTIPKLQTFLDANNLELWDIFEKEQPDTFKEMYEFWLQKKKDPAMIESPSAHGSATFPEYKAADRSFLDPSSPVK